MKKHLYRKWKLNNCPYRLCKVHVNNLSNSKIRYSNWIFPFMKSITWKRIIENKLYPSEVKTLLIFILCLFSVSRWNQPVELPCKSAGRFYAKLRNGWGVKINVIFWPFYKKFYFSFIFVFLVKYFNLYRVLISAS